MLFASPAEITDPTPGLVVSYATRARLFMAVHCERALNAETTVAIPTSSARQGGSMRCLSSSFTRVSDRSAIEPDSDRRSVVCDVLLNSASRAPI